MKLYRNLNDCLDSELYSQVITASFPLFIEKDGSSLPDSLKEAMGMKEDEDGRSFSFEAGSVLVGNPGEKPHVLESNRPSANFAAFEVTIKRAMAAALGIPYESLAKDYSRTNYSSMRAAVNEVWKYYRALRDWFSRRYTQPVWEMVIEEAYLRNYLGLADDLAKAKPAFGFYEGRQYWCSASWIGPAKGFIDPVKEIQATILALQNHLTTYAEAWAERGGDFLDALPVMEEELASLKNLPEAEKPLKTANPEESSDNGEANEDAES